MYFKLFRKVVLKDKFLFFLLNISLFLLSFVFLVSYFVINSLQNVHLSAIRDVMTFDFRIEGDYYEKDEVFLEKLRSLSCVDEVFFIKETEIFSKDSNDVFNIKFASPSLFENDRFKRQFIFFSKPHDNIATFSSSSTISIFSDYYHIKDSSQKRAIISPIELVIDNFFYTRSPVLSSIGFMDISCEFSRGLKGYYAIYSSDLKRTRVSLEKENIKYTDSFSNSTSFMLALKIEKYLFMFALFFIFVILLILFLRMCIKFINENQSNMNTLIFLGLDEKKAFLLLSLPMSVASIISCVLGSIFANAFSLSKELRDKIFYFIFRDYLDISLKSDKGFTYLYITICFLSFLLFSIFLYRGAKRNRKVDNYEENFES